MRTRRCISILVALVAALPLTGCGGGAKDKIFQGRQTWAFTLSLNTGNSHEHDLQLAYAMTNGSVPLPVADGAPPNCTVSRNAGGASLSLKNAVLLEGDGVKVRLGNTVLWRKTDSTMKFRLDINVESAILLGDFVVEQDTKGELSGTVFGYVILVDESGQRSGPFGIENGAFSLSPNR